MRTIRIKDRTITFDGATCRATWSDEAAEDMKRYHQIDLAYEIGQALVQEIDSEFNLTNEEKDAALLELKRNFDR